MRHRFLDPEASADVIAQKLRQTHFPIRSPATCWAFGCWYQNTCGWAPGICCVPGRASRPMRGWPRDFPDRWHIEEFYRFEEYLGWKRAGTLNRKGAKGLKARPLRWHRRQWVRRWRASGGWNGLSALPFLARPCTGALPQAGMSRAVGAETWIQKCANSRPGVGTPGYSQEVPPGHNLTSDLSRVLGSNGVWDPKGHNHPCKEQSKRSATPLWLGRCLAWLEVPRGRNPGSAGRFALPAHSSPDASGCQPSSLLPAQGFPKS